MSIYMYIYTHVYLYICIHVHVKGLTFSKLIIIQHAK